ncbi:hypothetical protein EDC65_0913 [Stella humosa]|uniref:Uncharacterized protein n=1 Tax=Stella humosa TaxID=94 RepID=A0A3N1MG46_9PROT|nr:hypothetical protein [Stella humosa]ROQ01727.1 hypothetical protein EDC65_0913 [Stella humosa]BBK32109.1 hypothetical protein STHU_27430 [Stella humosa]
MKDLRALLGEADGRARLAAGGVFTDPAAFLDALAPPAVLPGSDRRPIHTHQQPGPDIRRSVLAKLSTLEDLRRRQPEVVDTAFVLIDTDRAASSKVATRIAWDGPDGRRHMLKVTPPGTEPLEFRHLGLDPAQLDRVADRLAAYLRQIPGDRAAATSRMARLRPLLAPARALTLAEYATSLSQFLLAARLGQAPRPVMVSTLAESGQLTQALATMLAGLEGFVAAFNRAVHDLTAAGIDPAVGALAADWLPLFYSCPVDGERMRLRRQRSGRDVVAAGRSRAGRAYAFPLGATGCDLGALLAAGRWSPDVTLPVLLNDRFSGMVAGRSSALYGLVLATAMRTALGIRPIPMLVPTTLAEPPSGPDGLLQSWLTG